MTSMNSVGRSFRDPAGFAFRVSNRFLRAVRAATFEDFNAFLATSTAQRWVVCGRFIPTRLLSADESAGFAGIDPVAYHVVEHEKVPFPNYPEEWPPEMLHAAGALTLELVEEALAEGFTFKDATPYNVLFQGPRPILVDALSVIRRDPAEIVWRPYAQFVRTFLLPLAVDKHNLRPSHQVFMASREGLEPAEVYAALGWLHRLLPPWLGLATVPVWLSARENASMYRAARLRNPGAERAQASAFVLRSLFRKLGRQLSRVSPREGRPSPWSGYLDTSNPYESGQMQEKVSFVEGALRDCAPRWVLDVGCNTGRFSELAARGGADVVAIDSDAVAVGALWRRACSASLSVLPLVVDLSRPTPRTGWKNLENPGFLDRARGHFDVVLLLAVLHHLLITSRIPLEELLSLAAELTSRWLILEWVEPSDPMFQRLVRGRQDLYAHLTSRYFEDCSVERFSITKRHPIEGSNRILYLLRRRA